ncbi:PilW family protein [Clostridium neuense]|uniref:PilW family protein n=1 Tax=Clostridium neuense TaxID=1728934 RepID=A0ABW8TMQ7_9CLOT
MKHKGFTLIEAIAVVAMIAIFSLAVYSFEGENFKIYAYEKEEADLQFDCKISVTQISQDIRRAKQSKYSVQVDNFEEDRFKNLKLPVNYTPVVYIEEISGDNYLYAVKTDSSGNKTIVRLKLDSKTIFSLPEKKDGNSILDYNADNYKHTIDCNNLCSKENIPPSWECDFIYEDNQKFYLVYHLEAIKNVHYEVEVAERANDITVEPSSEKIIAKNDYLFSVTPITKSEGQPNSYNVFVTLTGKKYTALKKSYTMCISKIKYGGDD